MFTVIMRHDGVDRTYKCDNKWDAIVLFDAFTRAIRARVELWHGAQLEQSFDPAL